MIEDAEECRVEHEGLRPSWKRRRTAETGQPEVPGQTGG
jgi:hypothetical protein